MFLIALSILVIGNYLRLKLTEEIEFLFASIVTGVGLVLSILFAPLIVKFVLFMWLLTIKQNF